MSGSVEKNHIPLRNIETHSNYYELHFSEQQSGVQVMKTYYSVCKFFLYLQVNYILYFRHYYKGCFQNTLHLENCKFTQYTGNYGNKIRANSCYKGVFLRSITVVE